GRAEQDVAPCAPGTTACNELNAEVVHQGLDSGIRSVRLQLRAEERHSVPTGLLQLRIQIVDDFRQIRQSVKHAGLLAGCIQIGQSGEVERRTHRRFNDVDVLQVGLKPCLNDQRLVNRL